MPCVKPTAEGDNSKQNNNLEIGRLKGGLRQALLNLTTRLKNRHISALIILLQLSIVEWYY